MKLSDKQIELFWAKVLPTGFCWEWTGRQDRDGYGLGTAWINGQGQPYSAHRTSFYLLMGEEPEALDHLCRNKICVNPDHLDPVSVGENTLRGFGPSAVNKRKEECKRGHAFTETNTKIIKRTGYRECKTCIADAKRRYRAAKKS